MFKNPNIHVCNIDFVNAQSMDGGIGRGTSAATMSLVSNPFRGTSAAGVDACGKHGINPAMLDCCNVSNTETQCDKKPQCKA